MAKGALHSAAVLLSVLVAYEANGRTPLRQPGLISPTVADDACRNVGHVGTVVRLGVPRMAHPTVRGRLVMKGVAASADLHIRSTTGLYVASRAGETHIHMGSVWETPKRRRDCFWRRAVVAEQAVGSGRVVKAMAAITGLFLHRHGGSLMAGVTSKSHGKMGIVKEASPGEGDGVPGRRVMTKTASSR